MYIAMVIVYWTFQMYMFNSFIFIFMGNFFFYLKKSLCGLGAPLKYVREVEFYKLGIVFSWNSNILSSVDIVKLMLQ